jgi:hypothetical protein
MVKEDRPKGFVASMHGLGRVSEEVVSVCVVHGATSKFVIAFFPNLPPRDRLARELLRRPKKVEESENAANSGEKSENGSPRLDLILRKERGQNRGASTRIG